MDKRTRVLNAMDGKPVDRVPVGFWHHFTGEQTEGEAAVKAHLDFYREAGIDMLKVMSDGIGFEFPGPMNTALDWSAVRPNGPKSHFIEGSVERAKRIKEELKGECCLFYNIFAPFSLVRFFAGDDRVMAHIRENKRPLMDAMAAIAEDNAELVRRLITEAGCDGVYLSVQGGEINRFSAEEYEEIVTPSDLPALISANEVSRYNIFHMCGYDGVRNHLEIWEKYPARVYNWAVYIENITLSQGRSYLKPKADCILGGFDNRKGGLLYRGSREEICAETRRLLDDAGTLGTMLGADCTIPMDIPLEHLRWVVETAEEYGNGHS